MKKKYLSFPYMIWSLVFIIVPLILILYFSITEKVDGRTVFTLKHFLEFFDFKNNSYYLVLLRSLKLAFYCTVICLLIGYPTAYFLSKLKPGMRNFLILLMVLPMWMNFLLRTYAWLTLLEGTGVINSFLKAIGFDGINFLGKESSVVFGMVYNYLPYMVFPIYSSVSKIPSSLIEASQDLGGSELYCFRKVILPLSIPGIVSGITMVFVPGVTTFVISQFLGSGNVTLIGDIIERQFTKASNWGFGAAISIIVMIVVFICMWAVNKFADDEEVTLL